MSGFNFLPHTDADRTAMLATIGVQRTDDLFQDIPQHLRDNLSFEGFPKHGQSELELLDTLNAFAHENKGTTKACFIGGGAYNRFIPPAIQTIASRSEFYTAYTPYQPEVSQGTLQMIYEFQSMMAELTGLDVCNASVYDGGMAVTEATLMALRITKRRSILISRSVHPHARDILQTYLKALGGYQLGEYQYEEFDPSLGVEAVLNRIDPTTLACVILQNPDYFGCVTPLTSWAEHVHQAGTLLIVSADPTALGVLESPGAQGADIVVGDIQPLGNHLSYGGPYGGYVATREKYIRQLPGRLVGRTVDSQQRICYTLTLQTREQHIRREKATSNICTNQSLNILKATVYLGLMGPQGLSDVATLSIQRAHTLAKQLTQIPGVRLLFPDQPFASEFVLQLPAPVCPLLISLEEQGILGGIALERFYPEYPNTLLISVTEMNAPAQLAQLVQAVAAHLEHQASTPERSPLNV